MTKPDQAQKEFSFWKEVSGTPIWMWPFWAFGILGCYIEAIGVLIMRFGFWPVEAKIKALRFLVILTFPLILVGFVVKCFGTIFRAPVGIYLTSRTHDKK